MVAGRTIEPLRVPHRAAIACLEHLRTYVASRYDLSNE